MKQDEIRARLKRAEEAIASGRYSVTRVDATTFAVTNGDGQTYHVVFDGKSLGMCDCPDFSRHGGPMCKHGAIVIRTYQPSRYNEWVDKVLALAEDARTEHPDPEQPTNLTPIQNPIHSEDTMNTSSFAEILKKLAEPFPPSVVQWKPGVVSKDRARAMALAYVDSREYMSRLDAACPDWSDEYDVHVMADRILVICRLTIAGVTRVGDGEALLSDSRGETEENALTSASAQAFKRACTKFGLGRYLYDIPRVWADYDDQKKAFTPEGLALLQDVLTGKPVQPQGEGNGQKAQPAQNGQKNGQARNGQKNGQAPTQNGQGKPVQTQPASDPEVKFGKYAGKRISQIAAEDPDYVAWLAKEWQWEEGRKAAQAWVNHLGIPVK